jgi:hypothetical protein
MTVLGVAVAFAVHTFSAEGDSYAWVAYAMLAGFVVVTLTVFPLIILVSYLHTAPKTLSRKHCPENIHLLHYCCTSVTLLLHMFSLHIDMHLLAPSYGGGVGGDCSPAVPGELHHALAASHTK